MPTEQKFLSEWLHTIQSVAATNYALATEIATTRTLVKGYSDTHERGRRELRHADADAAADHGDADPAAALAALAQGRARRRHRRGAQSAAIKDIRPLPQAAE